MKETPVMRIPLISPFLGRVSDAKIQSDIEWNDDISIAGPPSPTDSRWVGSRAISIPLRDVVITSFFSRELHLHDIATTNGS